MQPRLAACCVSQVLGEPYDTSTTTPLDGWAESSIGSAASGSAVLSDEAFTSSVTSAAILIGSRSLNSMSDAAADVSLSTKAAKSLARFRRAAGDRDRGHAGLGERDGNHPREPARADQHRLLSGQVGVGPHQIHQCQALGVVAHQPRAVRRHAIDRAAKPRAFGELVEIFEHRHLVRLGDLHAAKAQRPDAAHRVAKFLGVDLERHEPPVEAGQQKRLLDHEMSRIAGHGAGDQAAFFDKRGAGHGRTALRAGRIEDNQARPERANQLF